MAECHLAHGHARKGSVSPTYNTWISLRRRCYEGRENYGARGITYDPRWDDFEAFLEDMGPRPDGTTLDRMDPDGHYEKANCRWATPREQVNNLRTNRTIVVGPFELSVSDWADLIGIDRMTIFARLGRGWDPVRALTAPVKSKHRPPRG